MKNFIKTCKEKNIAIVSHNSILSKFYLMKLGVKKMK